jgi:diguanylate cyclase (GGDEF)-like protein
LSVLTSRGLWCLLAMTAQLLHAVPALALDTETDYRSPVGLYLSIMQEGGAPLDFEQAQREKFVPAGKAVLSFGLGAAPVWLKLQVSNMSSLMQQRDVLIETSWLDQIDIYWLEDGQLVASGSGGDRRFPSTRGVASRYPSFVHTYSPGETTVLLRVESIDPMSLPVYFLMPQESARKTLVGGYSYGLLYGAVLSLLVYNLMLFSGLRDRRYLYFAFYLGSFLAMNLAYTGHGSQLVWGQSPRWQQFSNPLLMTLFNVAGLLFALKFLDLKQSYPRIRRLVLAACGLFMSLQIIMFWTGAQLWSLSLAFGLMLVFSSLMILLGIMSSQAGNHWARYFLAGAIAGALGSTVTACAVLGWIPYNFLTYRAIDIGMCLDIVLLAFALANQYRVVDRAKRQAEELARVDSLTGLNNRRAFYEHANRLWQLGIRQGQAMTVLLFDMDLFKSVNDTYGHAAGDEVLVRVSQMLQKRVRASDIAARWGGEEFILFLSGTDCRGATAFAHEIRADLAKISWPAEYPGLQPTASFGVAQCDGKNSTLEALISLADTQLYAAKNSGRDKVETAAAASVSSILSVAVPAAAYITP